MDNLSSLEAHLNIIKPEMSQLSLELLQQFGFPSSNYISLRESERMKIDSASRSYYEKHMSSVEDFSINIDEFIDRMPNSDVINYK